MEPSSDGKVPFSKHLEVLTFIYIEIENNSCLFPSGMPHLRKVLKGKSFCLVCSFTKYSVNKIINLTRSQMLLI